MDLQKNTFPYTQNLRTQFANIFLSRKDPMCEDPGLIVYSNPKRHHYLSAKYPMQKKGKNFGVLSQRQFYIQNQLIIQEDKNGQTRELPFPLCVFKQSKEMQDKSSWGFPDYNFRLCCEFESRNPINIYVRQKQQLNQLFSYFNSKIYLIQKQSFIKAFKNNYRQNLMIKVISSMLKVRTSKLNTISPENRYKIALQKFKYFSKDKKMIEDLMTEWHRKAVMTSKDIEKIPEEEKTKLLKVRQIVSELYFKVEQLKFFQQFQIQKGELKLWIGQKTHEKVVKFGEADIVERGLRMTASDDINKFNPFQVVKIFGLTKQQFKLISQSVVLSIWTTIQFQIETKSKTGENKIWRSDRFFILDLLKTLDTGNIKILTLWSGKQFLNMKLKVIQVKTQALKIEIPPQHQSFPSSFTYNLSPNHYPILNELIPEKILTHYIKSVNPQALHLQYTIAYEEYLQTQSIQSLSFSSFNRMYDLLQIDSIIEKLMNNSPYKKYANLPHKATIVYQHLIQKSSNFYYYDAQKFLWKYQCKSMRRFLSVIKAFDEIPRINYTQPFFEICRMCLKISEKQSLIKWRSNLFAKSTIGRQSLAFFLLLGILKSGSTLLLYNHQHTTLANNSLLFHFVLKKYSQGLYSKFLQIQLNIEAFFGSSLVCLLTNIFNPKMGINYGGCDELFVYLMVSFLVEKRQKSKSLQQGTLAITQQTKNSHYFSIISLFLAIIQLFDIIVSQPPLQFNQEQSITGPSAAYSTANSYIQYLHIFVSNQIQAYTPQLVALHHKYYAFCEQELKSEGSQTQNQYFILQTNLEKFHSKMKPQKNDLNTSSIDDMVISEVLEQIYSQFSSCQEKNEGDIRKISIVLDHIYLGQIDLLPNLESSSNSASSTSYRAPAMSIQIYQQNTKLYEHEYILPAPTVFDSKLKLWYQNIKHPIEIKLSRISSLSLIISYISSPKSVSYYTKINPRQNPSNYYIQATKELIPVDISKGGIFERVNQLYSQRFVSMQIYIKDSCDVDYLQNSVPNQYIKLLLLRGRLTQKIDQRYKNDIIFSNNFFKSFRLPDNNFNLLYSKFGWYGNHYLVPADRIVDVYLVNFKNLSTPPQKIPLQSSKFQNNYSVISQITDISSEVILKRMPILEKKRINQILFYTRCLYGRGLLPSITYGFTAGSKTEIMVRSVRGDSIVAKQPRQLKNEINQYQFNSCGNLVCYPLENFGKLKKLTRLKRCDLAQDRSQNSYVDFYIRSTQQLPLIRYLCFRPLQFYLQQQLYFCLEIGTKSLCHFSSSPNIGSNPKQQRGTGSVQKIMSLQKEKGKANGEKTRKYNIILTNYPKTTTIFGNVIEFYPYKFMTNPTQLDVLDFYSQGDEKGKILYEFLLNGNLSESLYFTIPDGIYMKGSHEIELLMDGVYETHSREMLLSQFLYLLKANIYQHLIRNKSLNTNSNHNTKKELGDKEQKSKGKEMKSSNEIIDVQFRFKDQSIPNSSIFHFFQFISQTKQVIKILAQPIAAIPYQILHQSSKRIQTQILSPLTLNPLYRYYTSFALVNGLWANVCILAKVTSPNYICYYVQEKYTNRCLLMKHDDVILGIEGKKLLHKLKTYNYTDNQLVNSKECVRKDLIRIF